MPRKTTTIADPPLLDPPKRNEDKTKDELRQEALNGVLQLAQFGCLAFGQFADAGAIGMHGPPIVTELLGLAEQNAKVASKVDLLIEVGPYAGIVAAAIPFLAQLFVNHGVFKAEQFANAGVVTPEELESDIKTQMMRQAMAKMQEQERIRQEMEEMRAQFDAAQSAARASENGDNV
jgi:hypothetical protein